MKVYKTNPDTLVFTGTIEQGLQNNDPAVVLAAQTFIALPDADYYGYASGENDYMAYRE